MKRYSLIEAITSHLKSIFGEAIFWIAIFSIFLIGKQVLILRIKSMVLNLVMNAVYLAGSIIVLHLVSVFLFIIVLCLLDRREPKLPAKLVMAFSARKFIRLIRSIWPLMIRVASPSIVVLYFLRFAIERYPLGNAIDSAIGVDLFLQIVITLVIYALIHKLQFIPLLSILFDFNNSTAIKASKYTYSANSRGSAVVLLCFYVATFLLRRATEIEMPNLTSAILITYMMNLISVFCLVLLYIAQLEILKKSNVYAFFKIGSTDNSC